MDDYSLNKRSKSGQIPAFGEWDYANELPITQYFECARQAGLIRFSSSSGETAYQACPRPHLYASVHHHHHNNNPLRKAIGGGGGGGREKRGPRAHVMEQKKQQAKVYDVTQPPPSKPHQYHKQPNGTHEDKDKDGTVSRPPRLPTTTTTRPPKPVDEDLYKIPPELLHTTKRKKMLRFVSCLVPACAS